MSKQNLDPNIVAYLEDVENGKFKDARPGTWVAYFNGKFVLSGFSKKEFLIELRKNYRGCLIKQVNIVEKYSKLPTVVLAKEDLY